MLNVARGVLSIITITITTIIVCVPIFTLGPLRVLFRARSVKRILNRLMDYSIDGWVWVVRSLIRGLSLSRIEERSDPIALDTKDWYVVISNHQSWADIIVLQSTLLWRIPCLKFFTKRELIYIPFVGLGMWFLGFPYVRRYSRKETTTNPNLRNRDRETTLKACEGFRERPVAVLNFAEGTRYTEEKHRRLGSRFQRLLNPRSGGTGMVLKSLQDKTKYVLDVTIVYPNGVPGFWDYLCGRCPRTFVYMQLRDLPLDDTREQLSLWINEIWYEKDIQLATLANDLE